MDEPGRRVLGDRYELDSLIASGGMGEVWRGRDTLLGRPVAVKLLRSEYTGDPTFLARFRAEATHAAALSHPNIAAVYDYGELTPEDGGEHLAYLVMELVEGAPLSTLLREEGPLSPEATMSVLRQTAVALAEAHHVGMVHRDVKPGNILVGPDERVKITDFGIAWSAGSVPLTEAGKVLGTPQYLSPEIAVGQQPSPASDVYSLGLVGYECLTGEPAFAGDNPVTVALKQVNEEPQPLPDDLPAGLRELVDEAVAKDPGERPPDGDAFVAALDRVRAGGPASDRAGTRAVPLTERPALARRRPPAGPARSRRRLRTVLPVVCALLAGVAAVLGLGVLRDDEQPAPDAAATGQQQTIELDGQDYVGRPVDAVALQLTALGLTVDRQPQSAPDVAPGRVTQLDPVGRTLVAGDAVTVFFADGGPADSAPAPAGDAPAAGVTGAAAPPAQAPAQEPETDGGTVPVSPATSVAPGTTAATESGPAAGSPTGTGSTGTGPTDGNPTASAPTESAPTDATPTDAAPSESPGETSAPSSDPDPGSTAPTSSPAPSSSETAPTSSAAASSATGSSSAAPPEDGQSSAPAAGWTGRGGRAGG